MKRIILAITVLAVVLSAGAAPRIQPDALTRVVYYDTFSSAPIAAADMSSRYDSATVIRTGSVDAPYIRFSIVRVTRGSTVDVPHIVKVQWREFQGYDASNAAAYWTFYSARFPHSGMTTTSEGTLIVWWF